MARLATLTPEQQLLGAVDLNTGVISYTSQPPTATAGSVTTFEPEIPCRQGLSARGDRGSDHRRNDDRCVHDELVVADRTV
jgi:hypothetical protein